MDSILFQVFSVLATIVSATFAYQVIRQYFARRKAYQLVWGTALAMFAVGAAAMVVAAFAGWSEPVVRVFYLFGAGLLVGYLALGSAYLLFPSWAARLTLVVLLILTAGIVALTLTAPIDSAALATKGWEAMQRPLALRLMVGIGTNGLGSIIIIGGALYSAAVTLIKKTGHNRAYGNILIGAGALVVASGNTLSGLFRIGGDPALALSIGLGVLVMFFGFNIIGRPERPKEVAH